VEERRILGEEDGISETEDGISLPLP